MAKALVIVESPAKAKTLGQYLGKQFVVKASVGHVKDLPKSKLGVELEEGRFIPVYVTIQGKEKILKEIRQAAEKAQEIYLAPDPDREGEAIAWHIAEEIAAPSKKGGKKKGAKGAKGSAAESDPRIKRVLFFEITKKAVQEAIQKPLSLNRNKYNSQQARRILDRVVGYRLSPLLWEKVQRGLSAGRVQSVAVRLICEREEEIRAFRSEEYWSIEGTFQGQSRTPFAAKLAKIGGEKFASGSEAVTQEHLQRIHRETFSVETLEQKERKRNAPPPFITSTLQQEAIKQLHFSAQKTMTLAQHLYEGVELPSGEEVGLITYMRTDSCRISQEALNGVRVYIQKAYGAEYLPEKPLFYKVRKDAHDAHEAIRPTSLDLTPETLKKVLPRDEWRLYQLIWSRFVACQMNPALYDQTRAEIRGGDFLFVANGNILRFKGCLAAFQEKEEEVEEEGENRLPELRQGERLDLLDLLPAQHFTQPPPRFSEAALVKMMEEKGIGRPSTYASILSNIVARRYVHKEEGRFSPTELGQLVNGLLIKSFPQIMDVQFTARMEDELDLVEFGEKDWQSLLQEFYQAFEKALSEAKEKMRDVKREEVATDYVCEKCGRPMVVKWGRMGHFLSCSGYPECKNSKEITRSREGKIEIRKEETTDEKCPTCNSPMAIKRGRFGRFLACSRYPECKTTKSITLGVKCPQAGCDGELTSKRTKKGRIFYGCSRYPKCNYAAWDKPLAKPCPQCHFPILLQKQNKKESYLYCPNKGCGYRAESAGQE